MKVQVAEPMKDPYRFMMAGGKIRAIYPELYDEDG